MGTRNVNPHFLSETEGRQPVQCVFAGVILPPLTGAHGALATTVPNMQSYIIIKAH